MDNLDDFHSPPEVECGFEIVTSSKKLKKLLNGEAKPAQECNARSRPRARQYSPGQIKINKSLQHTRPTSSPVRELSNIDFSSVPFGDGSVKVQDVMKDNGQNAANAKGLSESEIIALQIDRTSRDVFSASPSNSKNEQTVGLDHTTNRYSAFNNNSGNTHSAQKLPASQFTPQKHEQNVLKHGYIHKNMDSSTKLVAADSNCCENMPGNATDLENKRHMKEKNDDSSIVKSLDSLASKLSDTTISHSRNNVLTTLNRSSTSKPRPHIKNTCEHSYSNSMNHANNVRPLHYKSYNTMNQRFPRCGNSNSYDYMSTYQPQGSGRGGWRMNLNNNYNNYQYSVPNYFMRPSAQNNYGNYQKPYRNQSSFSNYEKHMFEKHNNPRPNYFSKNSQFARNNFVECSKTNGNAEPKRELVHSKNFTSPSSTKQNFNTGTNISKTAEKKFNSSKFTDDNATGTVNSAHKINREKEVLSNMKQENNTKVYYNSKLMPQNNGIIHQYDKTVSSRGSRYVEDSSVLKHPSLGGISSKSSTYRTSKITRVEGSFIVVEKGHSIPRNKCYLFGISLFDVYLKALLQIGQLVKYELEDTTQVVRECWIGSPMEDENQGYRLIEDFCRNGRIAPSLTQHLLRQTNYIPK